MNEEYSGNKSQDSNNIPEVYNKTFDAVRADFFKTVWKWILGIVIVLVVAGPGRRSFCMAARRLYNAARTVCL